MEGQAACLCGLVGVGLGDGDGLPQLLASQDVEAGHRALPCLARGAQVVDYPVLADVVQLEPACSRATLSCSRMQTQSGAQSVTGTTAVCAAPRLRYWGLPVQSAWRGWRSGRASPPPKP